MNSILLIGTLDTKGNEVLFMKGLVEQMGCRPLVIDIGMLDPPTFEPDITRKDVLSEIGKDPQYLISLNNEAEASRIMSSALTLKVAKLYHGGKIDAVVAIGGGQGSQMSGPALQQLPIGFPKVLVSTKAVQAGIRPYAGTKDVVIIPAVCDIAGINRITRKVLANAVGAAVGMLNLPVIPEPQGPLVLMSMMGLTTKCGLRVKGLLEKDGYEVIIFHCIGPGGLALEEFIRNNDVKCVMDLTLVEISNELFGGMASAGKNRLEAAGEKGVTQIIAPGSTDIINFVGRDLVPEKYRHRRMDAHNPQSIGLRMEKDDFVAIARTIAEKLNRSRGKVEVAIPMRGFSDWDGEGKLFYEPEANAAFASTMKVHVRSDITVTEVDAHINDPAFSEFLYRRFTELMKK